ncbi:TPA: hypothetical protein EYP83_04065 [Candidatus Geothermarchaeota archaeon]|nr:hypothetical protein [Candidatus Geothermarchaeota archaeon]
MRKRCSDVIKIQYFKELLTLAKQNYNLGYISEATGIATSTLSRYLHGRIVPMRDRLEELIKILEDIIELEKIVRDKLKFDRHGYLNNQNIISDIALMKFLALKTSSRYRNNIDIVLSPATDGIPYATLIAEYLNTRLVIAKDKREVGVPKQIEGTLVTEDGSTKTLYITRGLIRKDYRVLIVEDVIRTGYTHETLIRMIRKIGAQPSAIHVIIAVGDRWRFINNEYEVPIDAIAYL